MQEKIVNILNEMSECLNIAQMKKLQEVLLRQFSESERPLKACVQFGLFAAVFGCKADRGLLGSYIAVLPHHQ